MISIIIPTYNEQNHIGKTLAVLKSCKNASLIREIIVADGGSIDATIAEATAAGASVISSPAKGRAAQMNAGAVIATGSVLYFLHADSQPPTNFANDIMTALQQGYKCGCYRLEFDHTHWFLRANAWFTRFNINAVRFGDQSLFVTREVFLKAGGFNERLIVMEDQEIIGRIRKHGKFTIMNGAVITSARKYLDNGVYKMQAVFFIIYVMYQLGYSQQKLVATYRKLIRQNKV
jgi:rSAM/selenodomain-associated transferase 2